MMLTMLRLTWNDDDDNKDDDNEDCDDDLDDDDNEDCDDDDNKGDNDDDNDHNDCQHHYYLYHRHHHSTPIGVLLTSFMKCFRPLVNPIMYLLEDVCPILPKRWLTKHSSCNLVLLSLKLLPS